MGEGEAQIDQQDHAMHGADSETITSISSCEHKMVVNVVEMELNLTYISLQDMQSPHTEGSSMENPAQRS